MHVACARTTDITRTERPRSKATWREDRRNSRTGVEAKQITLPQAFLPQLAAPRPLSELRVARRERRKALLKEGTVAKQTPGQLMPNRNRIAPVAFRRVPWFS